MWKNPWVDSTSMVKRHCPERYPFIRFWEFSTSHYFFSSSYWGPLWPWKPQYIDHICFFWGFLDRTSKMTVGFLPRYCHMKWLENDDKPLHFGVRFRTNPICFRLSSQTFNHVGFGITIWLFNRAFEKCQSTDDFNRSNEMLFQWWFSIANFAKVP